jgi:type II secretory pathway pseudopilin PulG
MNCLATRLWGKRTRAASASGGFTIVETMIVIAVMGALFLSAALLIGGKQNQVAFEQAVKDTQDDIQQVASAANSGFYNYKSDFSCTAPGSHLALTKSASSKQGQNGDCILLGEAMQFALVGTGGTTEAQAYKVIPIAGKRDNGGELANAAATAVMPSGHHGHSGSNFPDASQTNPLSHGIEAVWMCYQVSSGDCKAHPIGAFAFVSSLGSRKDGKLQSGSQHLMLIPIPHSAASTNPFFTQSKDVARAIDTHLGDASTPHNPSGGVRICFASGATNKSDLVTVGGGGRALSVTSSIKDGRKCGRS